MPFSFCLLDIVCPSLYILQSFAVIIQFTHLYFNFKSKSEIMSAAYRR